MSEDRSIALCDTDKQPCVAPKTTPVAREGMRRWVIFGVCLLCLAALTALLLVYALASLPEWLSLLIGLLIVLLFFGMIIALSIATHAPGDE